MFYNLVIYVYCIFFVLKLDERFEEIVSVGETESREIIGSFSGSVVR